MQTKMVRAKIAPLPARICPILTWLYGHGYRGLMKTIAAGKFKDTCLKALDEVAKSRTPVVITKRGRPIAKLVPCIEPTSKKNLIGSVLKQTGDPFSTGER